MRKEHLYSRDARGKIITFIIELNGVSDGYVIKRFTGKLNGNLITQPEIKITKGKVKRTIEEQADLEYNSLVSSKKDKGYKSLVDLNITDTNPTYDVIEDALNSNKTTVDGYRKPVLAQEAVKQSAKVLAQEFYVSKKLDGVRTLVHLETIDGEDVLVFKSRGGKVYKGVAEYFSKHLELIALVKEYKCEIDGEFYTHGMQLKDINGTCQLEKYTPARHDLINFYIFDLADDYRTTDERVEILNKLTFEDDRVKALTHTLCTSLDAIHKLHDEWVVDGYEGAMARTRTSLYQWGKRSKDLLKFKAFQDDEFEIVGYKEGLRPTHDMCFILKTKDGLNTFEAKPQGTFADKQEYIDNMSKIIGQKGTVKYQYIIEDTGRPFLPSFKSVRYDGQ